METTFEFSLAKAMRILFVVIIILTSYNFIYLIRGYAGEGIQTAQLNGYIEFHPKTAQQTTWDYLETKDGFLRIFPRKQIRMAQVHFDHYSKLFQGLPLIILLTDIGIQLAILFALIMLYKIFTSLDRGEAFRYNNINRMRYVAFAVLAYSFLSFGHSMVLATYIQGAGDSFTSAYPAYGSKYIYQGVLTALVILALAQPFRLGAQLQQEQDLTI